MTHDTSELEIETSLPELPSSVVQTSEALNEEEEEEEEEEEDDDNSTTIQQFLDVVKDKKRNVATELNQPSSLVPYEIPQGMEGLNEDESLYNESYYFSNDEEEKKRREEAKKNKLEQEQSDVAYAQKLQDHLYREARAVEQRKGVSTSQPVEHPQQQQPSRGRGRGNRTEGSRGGGSKRGRGGRSGRGNAIEDSSSSGRRNSYDDLPRPRRGRMSELSKPMSYWL